MEEKMRELLERRIFDGPIMASDPDLIGIEAALATDKPLIYSKSAKDKAASTESVDVRKAIASLMKDKSKAMMKELKEKSARARAARMERGYMIDHDYEREKDEIRRRISGEWVDDARSEIMDLTGVFDGKTKKEEPEKDIWEKLADGEI